MDIESLFADEKLKKSSEKLEKIHDSVAEVQFEMRSQARDFYYKLALLSGGILSLSITFIGYLSSKSSTLLYTEFLYLSWILLIISMLGSLYRNHFHGNMGHWQSLNILNNARLDVHKAMLGLAEINPANLIDLERQDVNERIAVIKKNIKMIEHAIESVNKTEKKSSKYWKLSQGSAHAGFVAGLILITLFAALNLPIKVDFTIISSIMNVIR